MKKILKAMQSVLKIDRDFIKNATLPIQILAFAVHTLVIALLFLFIKNVFLTGWQLLFFAISTNALLWISLGNCED